MNPQLWVLILATWQSSHALNDDDALLQLDKTEADYTYLLVFADPQEGMMDGYLGKMAENGSPDKEKQAFNAIAEDIGKIMQGVEQKVDKIIGLGDFQHTYPCCGESETDTNHIMPWYENKGDEDAWKTHWIEVAGTQRKAVKETFDILENKVGVEKKNFYLTPGNHDAGDKTSEWKMKIASDYWKDYENYHNGFTSFEINDHTTGLMINSQLYVNNQLDSEDRKDEQNRKFREALKDADGDVIVFSHIPPFVETLDEANDDYEEGFGWAIWHDESLFKGIKGDPDYPDAIEDKSFAKIKLWMSGHVHTNFESFMNYGHLKARLVVSASSGVNIPYKYHPDEDREMQQTACGLQVPDAKAVVRASINDYFKNKIFGKTFKGKKLGKDTKPENLGIRLLRVSNTQRGDIQTRFYSGEDLQEGVKRLEAHGLGKPRLKKIDMEVVTPEACNDYLKDREKQKE